MVSVLFSTIRSMRSLRSESERAIFEQLLLNIATDLIPSTHGGVVLGPAPDSHQFAPILRHVLAEQVALAFDDEGFSVIAAPLIARDLMQAGLAEAAVQGTIYLAAAPEGQFNELQVETLAAVAVMAAAALEYRRSFDWLLQENERLQGEIDVHHSMVGESPVMRNLLDQVSRAAPSASTVLILGESGTGKELVARAIHRCSPRAARPFVAVNCAALTESLLESELFGHERGSFTGASGLKRGKLELAEGGTIFLDEVGETSPPLQAKLLRVLQEREFERVGGSQTLKLNIRLLAATNRDLQAQVRAGRFREDLYYRLSVITLRTPALRDRRSDILPLAQHFVTIYAGLCNRSVQGISPRAQRILSGYDWPGNVRELQNAIERAVVMGTTELVLAEDLPENLLDRAPEPAASEGSLQTIVFEAKRKAVTDALAQTGGNFTKAAAILGVHANYLHRLVNNLNLR